MGEFRFHGVQVSVPETTEDFISDGLRAITEVIARVTGEDLQRGFLGGEFGYGADYETDVFKMYPFCWCEGADCEYCRGCECGIKLYYFDNFGKEIDRTSWVALDGGKMHHEVIKECINCTNPQPASPNFVFKPTGGGVSWYKYIGRGMEIEGDIPLDFVSTCIKSIKGIRGVVK